MGLDRPKEAAMKERLKGVTGHKRLAVGVVATLGAIAGLVAWRRHRAHAA
jgi:hypothetical protein